MKLFSLIPDGLPAPRRRNYVNVQIDAIGVGIALASYPFITVLLTRLGASNVQVGLLLSLQSLAGLLFSIPLGRIVENRTDIVRIFSASRLIVFLSNILIGVAPLCFSAQTAVLTILGVVAVVTIPNTLVSLCFTLIMNEVAGPDGRFELLSRRWALIQLSYAVMAALTGFALSSLPFPSGYGIVFTALSAGAFLSFTFSRRIEIQRPVSAVQPLTEGLLGRTKAFASLVVEHRELLGFNARRFLFLFGALSVTPLLPLYYVRTIHADDSWIGAINTASSATLLLGYFFWTEAKRRKGSSFVLYVTMLGSSLFPFLITLTHDLPSIFGFALFTGLFQAGVDLLVFDELLKRIPSHAQTPLVAYSQSVFYLASITGPLFGTFISDHTGIVTALLACGGFRLLGALSFYSLPRSDEPSVPQ